MSTADVLPMITDNTNAPMSLTPVDDKNLIQDGVTDNGSCVLFRNSEGHMPQIGHTPMGCGL